MHRVSDIVLILSLVAVPGVFSASTHLVAAAQRGDCSISGTWSGQTIRDRQTRKILARFGFEFRADGTYTFVMGDEGGDGTQHQGRFSTQPSPGGASRYPCLIVLHPDRSSVQNHPGHQPEDLKPGLDSLYNASDTTFRIRNSVTAGDLLFIDSRVAGSDLANDIGSFALSQTR